MPTSDYEKTPEPTAFPSSILGVATAVPAFIGYTEEAETPDGKSVSMQPIQIGSMEEFENVFGAGTPSGFLLYPSLQLFYANGGGPCWVVSVGSYQDPVGYVPLRQGLDLIGGLSGPTLLAIPDAVLLPSVGPSPWTAPPDYWELVNAMIDQAATLQDRFAILDVYGSDAVVGDATLTEVVQQFQSHISSPDPSHGAAYFPFLEASPAGEGRIVPPSGALAGVYVANDASRGVWNAPANIALASVVGPTFKLTDAQQAELNQPLNGVAIDAIRELVGQGTLVWGARTLDGNSLDYRYIQVRRTLIYIEQSIKAALSPFAFAPNDGNTWATVTSLISSFLQGLWTQGGLMGATAQDAYTVQCGLGSTMTGQDILDGTMRVTVLLSMIRPAEFIELTIQQKMSGES